MDGLSELSALLAEADNLERSISSTIKSEFLHTSVKSDPHSSTDDKSIIGNQCHRVQWARALNLEYILATLFRPGTLNDGLEGIKTMTESEIDEACAQFSVKVKDVVQKALTKLKSSSAEERSKSTEGVDTSPGENVLSVM